MRAKILLGLIVLLMAMSVPAMAATESEIRAKVDDFLDQKISKEKYLAWTQSIVADESNDATVRGYAQTMIAVTLSEEGYFEEAYAAAQKAIAMRPDLPSGHQAIAKCLFHFGRFKEARESMEKAVELTREGPAKDNRKNLVALYRDRESASSGVAATPQTAAQSQRTIDVNIVRFINLYNETANKLHVPSLPTQSTSQTDDSNVSTRTYAANENIVVQFHYPAGKARNPIRVLFIGAGSGTQESGKHIMLSSLSFLTALTPALEPKARGGAAKILGLSGEITDGKKREWEGYGMHWTASFSNMTGLMIIVGPLK